MSAPGQVRRSDQGKHHLPAVGMTGDLQVEAPGLCALIGEIRFVRQQDRAALFGQGCRHLDQVRATESQVIHSRNVQGIVPACAACARNW